MGASAPRGLDTGYGEASHHREAQCAPRREPIDESCGLEQSEQMGREQESSRWMGAQSCQRLDCGQRQRPRSQRSDEP